MTKLRGKKKAEFLARMAKGRAKAARRRNAAKKPARKKAAKRKVRRRRNPELMTLGNPSKDLARAVKAFRQFHGVAPKKVTKGRGKGVLVALGELREIVYQPTRGMRKGPAFFHKFKPGNVLAVTADGKRLVIVDRKKRKAVDFDAGIVN